MDVSHGPTLTDWIGSIGGAIGGIGAAGALIYAAITYASQTSDRRREQANRVSAWSEPRKNLNGKAIMASIELLNSDDRAIYDCKVVLVDPSDQIALEADTASGETQPFAQIFRVLVPHRQVKVFPIAHVTLSPVLVFRDQAGRHWKRDGRGNLAEVDETEWRKWPPMTAV